MGELIVDPREAQVATRPCAPEEAVAIRDWIKQRDSEFGQALDFILSSGAGTHLNRPNHVLRIIFFELMHNLYPLRQVMRHIGRRVNSLHAESRCADHSPTLAVDRIQWRALSHRLSCLRS